ncbi:hypothetical protein [Megasphaera vaginalis (ex Srinivasan et al. 2021)]|uniref:DNA-directed RNA polymerase subunit P n=1 Tax=Megasphaera vaginalis (ex Srinivasan et al. 2021) TaxID=1111454 RepID=U7UB21_9FIRM|nr:hypothetical protein [Megasphaera vaginalis (ex Srinivasan et al. 2021)]ERT56516.1 hypothetical protein HMPREF1250_1566 [Megasphaera vaginalis (ex Srinivasan et al. 2021)]
MADTSVSYKCPKCGGPLNFQAGAEKVSCEYCSSEFDVKTIETLFSQQEEIAAQNAAAEETKWKPEEAGSEWDSGETDAFQVFTCSSCGAELVTDGSTMATECCYCGNPTMLPNRFAGMLKPDYVIPFKKTKEDAVAALKAFYGKKRLLPSNFKSNNRMKEIQGLYVPFWLFDSTVSGTMTFSAERISVSTTDDKEITETQVYRCRRKGSADFERIPVDGSTKMDDTFMESIEPFDYQEMQPFSQAYFTGYIADKYDVDAAASVGRADERVTNSMTEELKRTVNGYDAVRRESCNIVKVGGNVSYAVVPVWILTTRYENKPYTFMMNGQTGRLVGSLPIDKGKLRNYSIIGFIASFIAIYGITSLII